MFGVVGFLAVLIVLLPRRTQRRSTLHQVFLALGERTWHWLLIHLDDGPLLVGLLDHESDRVPRNRVDRRLRRRNALQRSRRRAPHKGAVGFVRVTATPDGGFTAVERHGWI